MPLQPHQDQLLVHKDRTAACAFQQQWPVQLLQKMHMQSLQQ